MSTTRFETATLLGCFFFCSLGFSRDDPRAPDPRRRSRALPTVRPYLGTMPFQGLPYARGDLPRRRSDGDGRQKEKRTLPRPRVAVSGFVYVAVQLFSPNSGSGILTPIPFRHDGGRPAFGSGHGRRASRNVRRPVPEPIVAFHEVNLCLRID